MAIEVAQDPTPPNCMGSNAPDIEGFPFDACNPAHRFILANSSRTDYIHRWPYLWLALIIFNKQHAVTTYCFVDKAISFTVSSVHRQPAPLPLVSRYSPWIWSCARIPHNELDKADSDIIQTNRRPRRQWSSPLTTLLGWDVKR